MSSKNNGRFSIYIGDKNYQTVRGILRDFSESPEFLTIAVVTLIEEGRADVIKKRLQEILYYEADATEIAKALLKEEEMVILNDNIVVLAKHGAELDISELENLFLETVIFSSCRMTRKKFAAYSKVTGLEPEELVNRLTDFGIEGMAPMRIPTSDEVRDLIA